MAAATVSRRRPKVGATVDPQLLGAVDAWVREHPHYDRSRVINEALCLWHARERDREMRAQYEAPNDVDPDEWTSVKAIQRAAAMQSIQRPGRD